MRRSIGFAAALVVVYVSLLLLRVVGEESPVVPQPQPTATAPVLDGWLVRVVVSAEEPGDVIVSLLQPPEPGTWGCADDERRVWLLTTRAGDASALRPVDSWCQPKGGRKP